MSRWMNLPNTRNRRKSSILNKPGVAGDVLQTPPSLINLSNNWWFVQISSYLCISKTIQLGTWHFETILITPCVSCVTCHMTCDTWHVTWYVTNDMSYVKREHRKKGKNGGASRGRVCYQRALPLLWTVIRGRVSYHDSTEFSYVYLELDWSECLEQSGLCTSRNGELCLPQGLN